MSEQDLELRRRLRETANGYYTALEKDVPSGLLVQLEARWSDELDRVSELVLELTALRAQRDELASALRLADEGLRVAGFQDVQPVRRTIHAALAKLTEEVRA